MRANLRRKKIFFFIFCSISATRGISGLSFKALDQAFSALDFVLRHTKWSPSEHNLQLFFESQGIDVSYRGLLYIAFDKIILEPFGYMLKHFEFSGQHSPLFNCF